MQVLLLHDSAPLPHGAWASRGSVGPGFLALRLPEFQTALLLGLELACTRSLMYMLIMAPACLDGCILGPAVCAILLAPKQHPSPSVPHHILVQGPAQEPLLRLASRWHQVSGQRPGPSCGLSLRQRDSGVPWNPDSTFSSGTGLLPQ